MGNYLSYAYSNDSNDSNASAPEQECLDQLTKYELINRYKNIKNHQFDYTDFINKTRDIELENIELLPMCRELYDKLDLVLDKYQNTKTSRKIKKLEYIKPEFDVSEIYARNQEQFNLILDQESSDNNFRVLSSLINPDQPIKIFNINPITVHEFKDFKDTGMKQDIFGISKYLLSILSDYHVTRLINQFNKHILDKLDNSKISLGKATFIYKKNDKTSIKNYRELVTTPIIVNHFHRLLATRLSDYLLSNKYLNTTIQKGSIKGEKKSIVQQVIKLNSMINHSIINKNKLVILFLDIKNAFGSINKEVLYSLLKKYYVDDRFVHYLKTYYDNFTYYVNSSDLKTYDDKLLNWYEGLIQGDPMSPILFNFVLTYILDNLDQEYREKYGYQFENIKLLLLAYVDDICLVSDSLEGAFFVFNEMKRLFERAGFYFSIEKCAVMLVNHENYKTGDKYNGFTVVDNMRYLGAYIQNNGKYIDSFNAIYQKLFTRIKWMNKNKKKTNEDRVHDMTSQVIPWINYNIKLMYDVDLVHINKLVAIINFYLRKWGYKQSIKIKSEYDEFKELITDPVIREILDNNQDNTYIKNISKLESTNEEMNEELDQDLTYDVIKKID